MIALRLPVTASHAKRGRAPGQAAARLGALLLALVLLALVLRPPAAWAQTNPGDTTAAEPAPTPTPGLMPTDTGSPGLTPTGTKLSQSASVEKAAQRSAPKSSLPIPGLQIGLGLPAVEVRAPALDVRLNAGAPSQTGAMLQVAWVGEYFRFGYARQLYRNALPNGTTLDGQAVDALAFDSDQFWSFVGWRPFSPLYLGLGAGWQRRLIRVLSGGTVQQYLDESRFLQGLMLDWALGPPFSLQLRLFRDWRPGFLQVRAASLQLAITAPF